MGARNFRTFMLFAIFLIMPGITSAATTTLTDVLGRKITLDTPVKRAVLGFYFEDYMAVGGEAAYEHVIGISREAWRGKVPANWNMYVKHQPSLARIADIGEVDLHNISLENIISLKPDVIILAEWQYVALKHEVSRLEELKIPVVVVDYNAQTVERHVSSTKIFGILTGQEKRAQELSELYANNIADVQRRVNASGLKKPKVYIEFGNKGPADYSFTYGKNMWGAMLKLAGADNIAEPFFEWWGVINPEQLLFAKPDAIFISGRENNKVSSALSMGVGVDKSTAVQQLIAFSTRNGWNSLPAIKNKQLFGVYQGASRTLSDFAMIQFIAKSLYPEQFKDVDPVKNYLDYYEKYLPVKPEGTFAVAAWQ
ncbi:ABC transporter substrate-binding protein [Serratia sp. BIGb0163]|uniref:ABC transporter substrate-binding protein n=1 Tax=Serratia sp. BIGb0163 TaxID=2940613 RepID=UPI0021682CD1|nr:ABC transporter substrate-binding protein [Serratia sp. BIGb0163]MCS4265692.1 ABC-type Fe3+-hydroxamate transport system substrate-binding protein [Serratia sp. BIGb0163]